MNPVITTLEPPHSTAHAKTILTKDGFTCSLLTLAPGDETPRREANHVEEHLLFVIDGEATIRFDDVNTILGKDSALLVPKGKAHVIAAHPGGTTKLLRVDIPPRQVVTPQILSFGS